MDTVEGAKGGKVLLTIHFVKTELMIAFLRDSNDSQSVIDTFEKLYIELRYDNFMSIMPIIVTDNGSEFSNPKAIEFDKQGNQRTHVFYCNASSPGQKGSIEKKHELIRMFIPKGESLDDYTQSEINLMMNHINSYTRPILGDKSPYEMMEFMYNPEIIRLLEMHRVEPDDVTLNKSIWKKVGTNNEFSL